MTLSPLFQLMTLSPLFSAGVSGCIINTCGWVTGVGFKILLNIVEAFHGMKKFVYSHLLRGMPMCVK